MDIIKRIIELAKEDIDSAGCHTIDRTAKYYYDLLNRLGYEKQAEEVYSYYEDDEKE